MFVSNNKKLFKYRKRLCPKHLCGSMHHSKMNSNEPRKMNIPLNLSEICYQSTEHSTTTMYEPKTKYTQTHKTFSFYIDGIFFLCGLKCWLWEQNWSEWEKRYFTFLWLVVSFNSVRRFKLMNCLLFNTSSMSWGFSQNQRITTYNTTNIDFNLINFEQTSAFSELPIIWSTHTHMCNSHWIWTQTKMMLWLLQTIFLEFNDLQQMWGTFELHFAKQISAIKRCQCGNICCKPLNSNEKTSIKLEKKSYQFVFRLWIKRS